MKKILLIAVCLLVASIGISCASAADVNNNTAVELPTHTVEQENTTTIEDCNMNTAKENNIQYQDDNATQTTILKNITIQNNKTNTIDASADNTTKLNITGPKINNSTLDIKGPKITGDGPKITMSQMDKDIYHFAKVFMNNPGWDLYDCIDYVRFHSDYKWHQISVIVARAHNIALHKYQGKEIMILGWEVTPESVNYRSQNFYGWK